MGEGIPEGWTEKNLKHFCIGVRGVSYKPHDLHLTPSAETVTLLRSNNIQDSGVVLTDVQYVHYSRVKPVQLAKDKDIAVCMSNGSRRLVGKSSSFRSIPSNGKYTVGAFCSIFRPTENVFADFVEQLFKSNRYSQQVELSLAGSAINNLKNSDLESYQFLCPPKPEQQKIASILTSVDEVIEKTEAQISKLQDLKKGMMQELLTKGIGHTEFKDSPVGRIPESWRVTQLGSLASFRNGLNFSSDNYGFGLKIVGVGDFKDYEYPNYATLSEINPEGVSTDEDYLHENDFVFVRSNGNRNLIGRCLFVKNIGTEKIAFSGFVIRCRLHGSEELDPEYVNHVFRSGVIRRVISDDGAGTNISNLSQKVLSSLPIPIPPRDEQKRIAETLDSISLRCRVQREKHRELIDLKKALMQDLLTGKVRVKVTRHVAA